MNTRTRRRIGLAAGLSLTCAGPVSLLAQGVPPEPVFSGPIDDGSPDGPYQGSNVTVPALPSPTDGGDEPLSILVHPAPVSACPGVSVTLSVSMTGSGPLFYQWLKDGVELSDTGRVVGTHAAVLMIDDLRAADAGSYRCEICRGADKVASADARLTLTLENAAPDFNKDCRVDGADLAVFFDCISGPAVPQAAPECAAADLDGDGDVDQSDFGVWQAAAAGPWEPAPAPLAGDPVPEDPVAHPGGPYPLDATQARAGLFPVALDASQSVPGTTGAAITGYNWRVPCHNLDPLTGDTIDANAWLTQATTQNDALFISGSGDWGTGYAFTRATIARAAGAGIRAQVLPGHGHAMWGFKTNNTNFSYTQMPYAIYFNFGSLSIYEGGTHRGTVGWYRPGTLHDARIDLKTGSGARYYIREVGESDWRLIYDSTYSSASNLLAGLTAHSGQHRMDNMGIVASDGVSGVTADCWVPPDAAISLTVTDEQSRTGMAAAVLSPVGAAPVADAGGPYVGVHGLAVLFDGGGSGDDGGIASYLWDFGDGSTGYGRNPEHTYQSLGSFPVTLTVTDTTGLTDTALSSVEITGAVACVPWRFDPINNTDVPHDTWTGKSIRLKGVFYGPQAAADLTYRWTFGDGTPDVTATVSNKRAIEVQHTYTGSPGALFTATLTVSDTSANVYSDIYRVIMREKSQDVEVNVAVDEGLWYLHKQQQSDGRWTSYSSYTASSTASTIQAFEINGHRPEGDPLSNPYVDTVRRGFDYLFTTLNSTAISIQAFGDPDSNGNSRGVTVSGGRPIYEGGMVMDALAASGAPDRVATTGGGGVIGRTYRDIVQDMMDQYAFGQEVSGGGRGGWRYSWDGGSDNSAAQWAAIGFIGARDGMGLEAPGWVKDENVLWLDASRLTDGRYGYTGRSFCCGWYATTPSGLVQLAWLGVPTNDARWAGAEDYIAARWSEWRNSNNVYAWYAFAKAMRLANPQVVNLNATGLDWYHHEPDGLARYILNRHQTDGGWPTDPTWNLGRVFNTAWQIIILNPTLFTLAPVADAGDDVVWAFDLELAFDASGSFHLDPTRRIVQYEWDFDGDGTWDFIGNTPIAAHTYDFDPGLTYPKEYTARLRVTDDAAVPQTDTDTRVVIIAEPPHAPFADPGGPYTVAAGQPFTPDGSGSFDIDPTDFITRYEWDFDGSDGYDFDNPDAACDAAAPGPPCEVTWVFDQVGDYNIGLRVWDNGVLNTADNNAPLPSLPAFTTVRVVVNQPPIAVAGGPYQMLECQGLTLDGSGSSDPNGDAITFAWDLDGDGEYDDSTSPAPTFQRDADGVYTVSLIVSDGKLTSEPSHAEVTVLDTVPTVTLAGPALLEVGASGAFTASPDSPCDEIASIDWDFDYDGIAFVPSGAMGAAQDHAFPTLGTYVVAVQVTDADGSTALATLEVRVAPIDEPRVYADKRIEVRVGRRSYDPVRKVHRAEFTLVSRHPDPIYGPIGLAFADITPASVVLLDPDGDVPHPQDGRQLPFVSFSELLSGNVLPPGDSVGPRWIEFSDPARAAFTFDAFAYLFNTPPRITSTPVLTAAEGNRYRYDVEAVDDDGDPIRFALRDAGGTPPPAGMTISSVVGLIDWVPGQMDAGTHPVLVVADDGLIGGEATQLYSIDVGGVNVAPVITSTPGTTTPANDAYSYAVQAFDPDGDPLTYALNIAPAGMTIDANSGQIDWPAGSAGTQVVRLSVSDDHSHTTVQEYLLTVLACNDPPVIDSAAVLAATEGVPYAYQVNATGSGPISYALPVKPAGMSIDGGGLISWTPGYSAHGLRTVKVVASTGEGCLAEQIFQIDVADANAPPFFVSTPPDTAAEGALYHYPAKAMDPDGDLIVYALVNGPPGMTIDPLTGIVQWTPAQDAAAGSPYPVTVRASDPTGARGDQTYDLTVTAEDLAPRIVSAPVYGAVEGQLYNYDVEAEDPDNDPLTYELLESPAGMSIDAVTGLIAWLPGSNAADSNPYLVQVRVSDPGGNSATQAFDIFVRKTNLPPMITSTPVSTGIEGEVYRYEVTATDDDGDALSFSLTVKPDGMSIHPLTGVIEWLVPQDAAAQNPHDVTVAVSDGAASDQQSFQVSVDAVNVAPRIFSTPVLTAAVGANYSYDVDANDPDDDPILYELTESPAGMTIDPDTGLIAWSPQAGQDGDVPVTVRASDPSDLFDEQSFVIATAECADAPQFTSAPKTTARPFVEYRYDVEAMVDAGTIAFSLAEAPAGMAIDPNSGLITWVPQGDQMGLHDVSVTAIRDGVCPGAQIFQVEVKDCDITLAYHQPVLVPGRLATFVPQVTANCEPLAYELVSGPDGMVIHPSTGVIQWVPAVGVFSVEVLATDAFGSTAAALFDGDVRAQSPPAITSTPPFTARVADLYSYPVVASDPDGDTLTFSLLSAPAGMTINATTGEVLWTPSLSQIGSHSVGIKADDGRGAYATQTWMVTVSQFGDNSPPQITSTPAFVAGVNQPYSYAVTATDPDNDTLTFSLSEAPAGASIDGTSGLLSWTPLAAQLGGRQFKVRVDDGRGGWATQSFTVTVSLNGDNAAPAITSEPIQTAAVNAPYVYAVTATDPDGDTLAYQLEQAPAGMTIVPATGLIEWTPTAGQLGTHDVTVRADDGRGGWARQSYGISVSEFGDNTAPRIISTPPLLATAGAPYGYQVQAVDEDGDALTYALITSPAGMVIDPIIGLIVWSTTSEQLGTHPVEIEISDGRGGTARQSYAIAVSTDGSNHAPAIISAPPDVVVAGEEYTYAVAANDEDGDTLAYSLTASPAGMIIDAGTGLVTWTTTGADVGVWPVTVHVEDPEAAYAEQTFQLRVRMNTPPTIVSTPVRKALATLPYRYDVDATDPDEPQLTYELRQGPSGMTIDPASGEIAWAPLESQAGDHPVSVAAIDSQLAEAVQDYVLTVYAAADADIYPPEVVVIATPRMVDPGEPVTIRVEATDDFAVASIVLTVNDAPVALNAANEAVYIPAVPGAYVARAMATDLVGHTGSGSDDFAARVPGDDVPPTVAITAPVEDSELRMPTTFTGTAADDNLFRYTLSYRTVGDVEFIGFATGYSSVTNGALGQLDPTAMINGMYEVRLRAEDTNGNFADVLKTYTVGGDAKVGNMRLTFTDLDVPVSGIPITVVRTYDNRDKSRGDFGIGWTLDISSVKLAENRPVGEGWEESVIPGFFPTYTLRPIRSNVVSFLGPDGRVERFEAKVNPSRQVLFPITFINGVEFSPLAPATSTLVATSGQPDFYDGGFPGTGDLISLGEFDVADISGYVLTQDDGTVLTFGGGAHSRLAKLRAVRDPNGNELQFTSNGIVHSAGKSVGIKRDGSGRITEVTDPSGEKNLYAYDDQGNLSTFTDRAGNTTTYIYNNRHDLIEIIDARGVSIARSVYDDEGRLVLNIDSDGNRTEYEHDMVSHREVVRDRLGNATTYEYDEAGNVTAIVNPLGHRTEYTYDDNWNRLTETNPLGHVTTFTYDAQGNVLSQTDPLGNRVETTYNSRGEPLTITDARGNTTVHQYDSRGNLLRSTDANGNVTTASYSSAGNITTEVDPSGNITRFSYDSAGNQLSRTDAMGNVTAYSYDGQGNQRTETRSRTLPDGSTQVLATQYGYDANGRIIRTVSPGGVGVDVAYTPTGLEQSRVNPLGRSTNYFYDDNENLVRTVYPDGTEEASTYDAEGRQLTSTDRAGRVTAFSYDAAGQLLRTTYPDGSFIENEHDAAGRVIRKVDERGNATTYVHDPLGRVTEVTDALGNTTSYAYDENGNQVSMTDALGRTTQYEYDPLNQMTRTILPDGTEMTVAYDAHGQKVEETDQAGLTTRYEYDALQRLTRVIDALGNATTYTYDEVGNRIAQTDANGHVTRFEYDGLGREIRRVLPMGMAQVATYDAAGNVTSMTDPNGETTTFTYDVNDRLVMKELPGGSMVAYTYTPTGQRATVVDGRGTTSYQYDNRDRLVRVTEPEGGVISYEYDAVGNRTAVTTVAGTTRYAYDALNRLETVTAPDNGITRYTYDAVGNRATLTYPNGVVAEYTYDDLNRLTRVVNRAPGGAVRSSYVYTLGPRGNRLRVVEHTGRSVDYTYDGLYRLTQERIDDPGSGLRVIGYSYDPAGNRLLRSDGLETVSYVYDDNDRLTSEIVTRNMAAAERRSRTHQASLPPSKNAHRGMIAFGIATGLTLLTPLTLLMPGGGLGRRRRLRRALVRTVSLFVLPVMLLCPENVHAMHQQSMLYLVVGTAPLGATTVTTYTYAYDHNGNTLTRSDGTRQDTYTYDHQNRLTAATTEIDFSGAVTYVYDADGVRIAKDTGALRTDYLVDTNRDFAQVVLEVRTPAAGDASVVDYVYGDDRIAMNRSAGVSYFLYDGQMSTRQLADDAGAVTDTYNYEAFGGLLSATGTTPNEFRHNGEQHDPNIGFYYLRARYYAQALGRFINPDPAEGSLFDPMSLHKYLYAHADPVNNSDPSGLFTLVSIAITSAIVGVLAGITAYAITGSWKAAVATAIIAFVITALTMLAITYFGAIRAFLRQAFDMITRALQRLSSSIRNGINIVKSRFQRALNEIRRGFAPYIQLPTWKGGGNSGRHFWPPIGDPGKPKAPPNTKIGFEWGNNGKFYGRLLGLVLVPKKGTKLTKTFVPIGRLDWWGFHLTPPRFQLHFHAGDSSEYGGHIAIWPRYD